MSLANLTNVGCSTSFLKQYPNDFLCVLVKGKPSLYYFDSKKTIWIGGPLAEAKATDMLCKYYQTKLSKQIAKVGLTKELKQSEKAIGSTSFLRDTIEQIKKNLLLKQSDVMFDTNDELKFCLNFKNGILDLKKIKMTKNKLDFSLAFRERTADDLVSKTLDWKFKSKCDAKKLEETEGFFKQIQPEQEQRDLQLLWLAYCLTGDTSKSKFKMNIGPLASNGKSTEADIHSTVFDIYSTDIDRETFNKGFTKKHKVFHPLLKNPIRFAYIEELDRQKLDIDTLKRFVDGKKQSVEELFGTTVSGILQAKLTTTSNKDPNFNAPDRGLLRRGIIQNYTSVFHIETADYEMNKTLKHNYKADPYLINK